MIGSAAIATARRLARRHPELVEQAKDEIRRTLGEVVARYAARMDSPVLWSAFHRARAQQIKGGRWWPGRGLLLAHHWRLARRYAAKARADKEVGGRWSMRECKGAA